MAGAPDHLEVFRLLADGVANPASPWRTPTLATNRRDAAPAMRSVVLRAFDPRERVLELHTDRRSAKFGELAQASLAGVHVWDAARRLQTRLAGRAALLTGDDVEPAWVALRPESRATYAVSPGPGTPVCEPEAARRDTAPDAGRAVFAVIKFMIGELEWLDLAVEGHRRALITWAGEGLTATWLVP